MASNPMAAANTTNFIPQVWSRVAKDIIKNKLVCANLTDKKYQKELSYGDRINIPNVPAGGAAAAAPSRTADITLDDAIANVDILIVNQNPVKAWGVFDPDRTQMRPQIVEYLVREASYRVAKHIDTNINGFYNSFTNTVGTEGSGLTYNVIKAAMTKLDLADAPQDGRVLVIDPESKNDLMGVEEFVNNLYRPGNRDVQNGWVSRILGFDVYVTNNLEVVNTSYHGAAAYHPEAIALVMQESPDTVRFRWEERFTEVVGISSLYGSLVMRDAWGVFIKTRA